jgi:hypothetical protein
MEIATSAAGLVEWRVDQLGDDRSITAALYFNLDDALDWNVGILTCDF